MHHCLSDMVCICPRPALQRVPPLHWSALILSQVSLSCPASWHQWAWSLLKCLIQHLQAKLLILLIARLFCSTCQNVSCSAWLSTGHFCMTRYLLLFRWTRGLLKVLQQPLSSNELQLAAAAVHAVSAMSLFVQHVQADTSQYCMLTQAAACALQAGNR